MTKSQRVLLGIGAGAGGLLAVGAITSVFVLRSDWFANYVREKVIATVQESTGGVAEIGSFQFEWSHLHVRITNFVLHGTEPAGSDPLLRASALDLRLKLLSSFKKAVDLEYLGVETPQANVMVFPNGKTNVPEPKVKKQSSDKSGLETVVNLAVHKFKITNGRLKFAEQKTALNVRGENLRAELLYNTLSPSYQGNVSFDPLLVQSGTRPPLRTHVNLPVKIEKDAIRLTDARISTDRSQVLLNASVEQMNNPQISGHLNASVSLEELQRSVDLSMDPSAKGAPNTLTADIAVRSQNDRIEVQGAHVALGQTKVEASGLLKDGSQNAAVRFNGTLALAELSRLFKVTSPRVGGLLDLNGNAKLDARSNYVLDGALHSKGLSLTSGKTRLTDVSVASPFHVDPFLISLDGLKLNAFGGGLNAKIFIEKMRELSVEGTLHNLGLAALAQAFAGKRLGYDGTISGPIQAKGDLKAKGTTGYTADARLVIAPGKRGVPVSGRLNAGYRGASGIVTIADSYLAMPNSRVDLAGSLNNRIDVKLTSRNLNDFLPAAAFASSGKPPTSLPVTLHGGTASLQAQITGNLSSPRITAQAAATRFAVEQRSFDNFSADLAASPSGLAIQNGRLARNTAQTSFDLSIGLRRWSPVPKSPVNANVSLRNGDLADLLSLAGEGSVPASGQLTADIHVNGTYGNPLGSATVEVLHGSAYQEPFDRLYTKVILSDQLITLSTLQWEAGAARLNASGTFSHPRDSFTVGHAQVHVASSNLQLANMPALQKQSPGVAGLIQLTADASADVREVNRQSQVTVQNLAADLSARGLRVRNQDAGDLTASARTTGNNVNYRVDSNFAGSAIQVTGQTTLTPDYPTIADASIVSLPIEKALRMAEQNSVPASGLLSAKTHVAGTLKAPTADLNFTLAKATIYSEPLDRLQGVVHYTNTLIDVPSLELSAPAGRINLTASFAHPANDFHDGAVKARINSSDVQLEQIRNLEKIKPGLAGSLHLVADLSANLRQRGQNTEVLVSNLNADAGATGLRLQKLELGDASFKAQTSGANLNYTMDSNFAQSRIHGSGQTQLTGEYQTRADLNFANVKYSNLAPLFSEEPSVRPSFDGLVEGRLSVNGPALRTGDLTAKLQLDRLELATTPRGSITGAPAGRTVTIHNDGAIILQLAHLVLGINQAHLTGPSTDIQASGQVDFKSSTSPLQVSLKASTDLGILQDVDRDIYSSGQVLVDAAVRGSFSQPLVNGQIELKNANFNMANLPNGLSNGNGVILLNGTSASIQNLTGEMGGGKVAMTGFVGLTGTAVSFNLKATANKVRTRYSGVSVTSNATLSLTGNTNHSLVGGRITVQRIAYQSDSDAGSILSTANAPVSTPAAPSPFLASMKLDIRVVTAPDLRVVTTYAQRLRIEADISVRGTAATPGLVGRANVTDGELVFFGNEYTVNQGTITFYNPTRIEPVLNVALETTVQSVDVLIDVQGPVDNLKLSYRSDPPLRFEEIVELLASNKTPASDPTIAAHQPTPPQQSLGQMGESAVVSQAVASPLSNRLQRVFGVSQFKIDPSFQGNSGLPQARVTLQQQVTSTLTFTYITDVTQTNSQIIRVEWAFTPRFSAVALRDENGVFGVDFFYKSKIR